MNKYLLHRILPTALLAISSLTVSNAQTVQNERYQKPELYISLTKEARTQPITVTSNTDEQLQACYECLGSVVGCTPAHVLANTRTTLDALTTIIQESQNQCTNLTAITNTGAIISVPSATEVADPGIITLARMITNQQANTYQPGDTATITLSNNTPELLSMETGFTLPPGIEYHHATPTHHDTTLVDTGATGLEGAKLVMYQEPHLPMNNIATLELLIGEHYTGTTIPIALHHTTGYTTTGTPITPQLVIEPHELHITTTEQNHRPPLSLNASYTTTTKECIPLNTYGKPTILQRDETLRTTVHNPKELPLIRGSAKQNVIITELDTTTSHTRSGYNIDPYETQPDIFLTTLQHAQPESTLAITSLYVPISIYERKTPGSAPACTITLLSQ